MKQHVGLFCGKKLKFKIESGTSPYVFFYGTAISRSSFQYDQCIGKGGFGKVWKVVYKKYKKIYAMKEMNKARILTKRSVKSVMNERQILTLLNSPFLVNMYYAF